MDVKLCVSRAAISETDLHKIAQELKADKHWVDGDALDRATGNRPHQVIFLISSLS